MNKPAIHHITNTLGTDTICEVLGVSSHSVRNARTTGLFPASWYDTIQVLCIESGIPCPRNAFNWRAAAKKTSAPSANGNANANRQAVGRVTPRKRGASA